MLNFSIYRYKRFEFEPSKAAAMRTHDTCKRVARAGAAANDILFRKGIQFDSPLYDLNLFDTIKKSPPDPMHTIDSGVCKLMMSRLFQSQSAKDCSTDLDAILCTMKTVREHAWKTRTIDLLGRYKTQEFCLLVKSVFPYLGKIILENMHGTDETVDAMQKCVLAFTFLVKYTNPIGKHLENVDIVSLF